ncbi:MAG: C-terminal target protein, partial [Chloroflexi bacterium]|nr:C-terminal target protein [Chloroflexota bacterium]
WNTKPALGAAALVTTVISTAPRFYTWNVGPYVVQQQGVQAVSLALVMPVMPSDNAPDRFNSREASSNQPQLVVTTK